MDLFLRPAGGGDIPDMCQWLNAPEVAAWMSSVAYPFRSPDGNRYLTDLAQAQAEFWTITRDGRFLGQIGIGDELGYWLVPQVWGRGYATQATMAVLDHAFASGRERVLAGVHPDNQASMRVLEKLGFSSCGVVPGYFAYHRQIIVRPLYCLTAVRWQCLSAAAE